MARFAAGNVSLSVAIAGAVNYTCMYRAYVLNEQRDWCVTEDLILHACAEVKEWAG